MGQSKIDIYSNPQHKKILHCENYYEQHPFECHHIKRRRLYYKTTLDFTKASHFEVEQAYAQKIVEILSALGAKIDNFLYTLATSSPETPELSTLITRSYNLISNMPQQCKNELAGMATVFNYPIYKLGYGILSTNELLTYEVLHDVIDPSSYSVASV
jgi:hypothetical protein